MFVDKPAIQTAIDLLGLDEWNSNIAVPNRPRQRPDSLPGDGRIAAVLVLLYAPLGEVDRRQHNAPLLNPITEGCTTSENLNSNIQLILTRRHKNLSAHAGQISFPGGRQDPGETLTKTALRETEEEIGVSANRIQVMGQLNPIYIPPSDFTVTPYVGWVDGKPEFTLAEDEVDELIEVPVHLLLEPKTLVHGEVESVNGTKVHVNYFQVDNHQVWGATAIILSELVERIRRVLS